MQRSPGSDAAELVPASLPVVAQLAGVASARPWLTELPQLIEQVRSAYRLRLSAPLPGGSCSWVAPAVLPDGTPVIVKIGWPHREMYGEPTALRLWNGRGAVRLLAHDPQRHALVLERMARIQPGYDPALVAEGARLLRELPASAAREALLHGDFNPGNVLSAGDGRWLAIDPKPLIGDPAYDPWPLLEQVDDPFGYPDPARVLRDRVDLVAAELALDPQRIVRWSLARRVEAAVWAAQHGDVPGGAAIMREARTLADL